MAEDAVANATTRHLAIVRHAKARAADPGQLDHARPLTNRGHRDARQLGSWLAGQLGQVDRVLTSSAVRAVQTWEAAAEAMPEQPPVDVLLQLYQSSPGTVLREIRQVDDRARRLVVVGHEPIQSALVLALAGDDSDRDALQELQEGYRTGAVALLELDGRWADLRPQEARLVAFAVPRA
ncbi:MAG TPA: histidine phosphatase family protein [Actinomycetales bacterium]|nr:histidine phosphatase family protein [Actinomycetales bacterium]